MTTALTVIATLLPLVFVLPLAVRAWRGYRAAQRKTDTRETQ